MGEKMDLNDGEIEEVFGIKLDSSAKNLDVDKTPSELKLPLADLNAIIDEVEAEKIRKANELQDAKDRKMFDTSLRDKHHDDEKKDDSLAFSPMKTSVAAHRHKREQDNFLNNRPTINPKSNNSTTEEVE